ncbi:4Fe-4S dicluster domain-containing protein [Marinifilum fragile]|uniref:4Fe-4S dicluster domain-containing protein n=1 Tax=Marinifilum fragile TaxID=570161 RepID=UPI002AA8AA74|nr:4Fe-4S dicluster domain-containing protein [Marinifilum fragile]
MRYAMVIDTKKCVGCSDCVVACQNENRVPIGYCRDWVIENAKGTFPNVSIELRSERCNHCENSPCVRCCPTGASHYEEGGVVKVTRHECIGCGACVQSCPYDARYSHPDGFVDKCTFCHHRLQEGKLPSCVSVCPTECMYFGDLDDQESKVYQLLQNRDWKVLAPEVGTKPHVYYLI